MSLISAHRGYAFQHIYSAAVVATGLRHGVSGVLIDKKRFRGDVFDDLGLTVGGATCRVQFKSHTQADRLFSLGDLRDSGAFPLAQAFKTYADDPAPADNYRLVATWHAPGSESLAPYFVVSESEPILPGSGTLVLELASSAFWQDGSGDFDSLKAGGTQADFEQFCAHFRVELEAPQASLRIDQPGQLELRLFEVLRDDLGVGLWPNERRTAEDAADSIIWAVNRAQARPDAQLDVAEMLQVLSLSTDFGRVPEAFPIDNRWRVGCSQALGALTEIAKTDSLVVVTGPPGCGKSWLLQAFTDHALALGWPSAIHFCFVDPLDESLRPRTTVETTVGSLIAGLQDSCEYEPPSSTPLYAARPEDLVEHVRQAVAACPEGRVLLVVDGLDHVSRIEPVAVGRRSTSEKVAEALANLDLPDGACLIVGSQPGSFLDCLEHGTSWEVPPWDAPAALGLLEVSGLACVLESEADSDATTLAEAMIDRSAGNALYLTYLAREIQRERVATNDSGVQHFERLLSDLPAYDAGLAGYYDHLLDGVRTACGSLQLVELMALVDFPLGQDELEQIQPATRHHVQPALTALRPVLSENPRHGGVRIYHESFQRFIRDRIKTQGADFAAILRPVVDWLRAKGFLIESRAFRSLARTLILSGRSEEAFALCGPDFVASAVGAGFGYRAVRQVLNDVAASAAHLLNWGVLARVNELMNAAVTCYEWKLVDDEALEFVRTLAQVRDAQAVAERLVHEGRPEYGYRTGLLLCAFCDEAGAIAPWDVYFEAYDGRTDHNTSYGDSSDELLEGARLRGYLRVQDPGLMLSKCLTLMKEHAVTSPAAGTIGEVVCDALGPEALDALIDGMPEGPNKAQLLLSKALHLDREGEAGAAEFAQAALDAGLTGFDRWRALSMGAEARLEVDLEELRTATATVLEERVQSRPEVAVQWLQLVSTALRAGQDLSSVDGQLVGAGWYRCWLRFCVELERCRVDNRSVVSAFMLLENDVRPFEGTPRACDLYDLRQLIHETVRIGLTLTPDEDWEQVLGILIGVGAATTTYLQRSPGGPLTMIPLLHLVWGAASSALKVKVSGRIIQELVAKGDQEITYYELHAHYELVLSQAAFHLGDTAVAEAALNRAAGYLSAYGFHKDTTIFGLLDPFEYLHSSTDPDWTRTRLAALQVPVEALLTHTDGKETRHAFPAWNALLGKLDPIGALRYSASLTRRSFGRMDYSVEDALPTAIAGLGAADPLHLLAAQLCLVNSTTSVGELTPPQVDSRLGRSASRLLGVARDEDMERVEPTTIAPYSRDIVPPEPPSEADSASQLCRAIEGLRYLRLDDVELAPYVEVAAGRLIAGGRDASDLLARFAEASETTSRNRLLELLAKRLEAEGIADLAAACLVLSFTRSGDGWRHFGHADRLHLIVDAFALDQSIAKSVLADETLEQVLAFDGSNGVTDHLPLAVGVVASLQEARTCWDEAFAVVAFRLPQTGKADRLGTAYLPQVDDSPGAADEALAGLAFARLQHVSLERRARATLASTILLANGAHSTWPALATALSEDMSATALSILLSIAADFADSRRMSEEVFELAFLAEATDLLCLRLPARRLLGAAGHPVLSAAPLLARSVAGPGFERRVTRRLTAGAIVWDNFPALAAQEASAVFRLGWVREMMSLFVDNVASPSNRKMWGDTWSPWAEANEIAINTVAARVRSALALQGDIDPASEDQLGAVLLPNWPLRIRERCARSVRPADLVHVSGTADGQQSADIPTVGNAGAYRGWFRVAHIEYERRKGERFDAPQLQARSVSGLVFGALERPDVLPLGVGHSDVWVSGAQAQQLPRGFGGPIACLDVVDDYCGGMKIMTPRPAICIAAGLAPAEWHEGLLMLDVDGDPAVVYETWCGPYVGGHHLGDEFSASTGGQLLMRPDILELIRDLANDEGVLHLHSNPFEAVRGTA